MGCRGSQASVLLLATLPCWDPGQACGFLVLSQALVPSGPLCPGQTPEHTGGTAGLEGPWVGVGGRLQLGPGQLCPFPTVPSIYLNSTLLVPHGWPTKSLSCSMADHVSSCSFNSLGRPLSGQALV